MDVLLGIEPYHLWKAESDHSKGDWKDGVPLQPSYEQQDAIFQHFIERYPNLKCIARHVRYAVSYTHLDVYKRQGGSSSHHVAASLDLIRDDAVGAAVHLFHTCLLYTSRCV